MSDETRTGHLPGCTTHSLAETYPAEVKPDDMPDDVWTEIRFWDCVEGCPRREAASDLGRKLAAERGW